MKGFMKDEIDRFTLKDYAGRSFEFAAKSPLEYGLAVGIERTHVGFRGLGH
jgi:hypothetical protein